jgi:L-cysteine S-thiosulfotransferase
VAAAGVQRRGWSLRSLLLAAVAVFAAAGANAGIARAQTAPGGVKVVGDAIPAPLTGSGAYTGDPARGRAIVTNRQVGLCLLCHSGPFPEERFQGDVAPDLNGVGGRFSAGQLRLRMVDSGRINAATIMPAYYRIEGFTRVAPAFQGKPVLSAEQIEDVVAFLTTLRN